MNDIKMVSKETMLRGECIYLIEMLHSRIQVYSSVGTVIYSRITYKENKADSNFALHEAQTKHNFS